MPISSENVDQKSTSMDAAGAEVEVEAQADGAGNAKDEKDEASEQPEMESTQDEVIPDNQDDGDKANEEKEEGPKEEEEEEEQTNAKGGSVEDESATKDKADGLANLALRELTLADDNDGDGNNAADDLSSLGTSITHGAEMAMSHVSDDSFTYMAKYCGCDRLVEKVPPEGESGHKDTGDNDDPVAANDGAESFITDLSLTGKANKRASKQRPQPVATMDVVDILKTPQEEESKTKNNDDEKKSGNILGTLFGSCIGCGGGGGGGKGGSQVID